MMMWSLQYWIWGGPMGWTWVVLCCTWGGVGGGKRTFRGRIVGCWAVQCRMTSACLDTTMLRMISCWQYARYANNKYTKAVKKACARLYMWTQAYSSATKRMYTRMNTRTHTYAHKHGTINATLLRFFISLHVYTGRILAKLSTRDDAVWFYKSGTWWSDGWCDELSISDTAGICFPCEL